MKIVVGVDGSRGSYAALLTAVREGADLGCPVEVVQAWQSSFDPGFPTDLDEDVEQEARRTAERLVHDARSEVGPRVPDVTVHTERGEAGHVLVRAAGPGDRLVVGADGHGAVGRLLLGSVTGAVLRRARCPVLVVPCSHHPKARHRREATVPVELLTNSDQPA